MASDDDQVVRHVADTLAIHDLLAEFTHSLDAKNPEAWADCFTPDGCFEAGDCVLRGRDQIIAYGRVHATIASRHLTTSPQYRIGDDGKSATGRANTVVIFATREGYRTVMTGRYDDRLKKVDGRWLFEHRRVTADGLPEDPDFNVCVQDPAGADLAARLFEAMKELGEPVSN